MKHMLTLWMMAMALHIHAQVNTYFNNDPVWTVQSTCAVPLPCIETRLYNYYTNGDTLINGMMYKQIFNKGTSTFNWMASPPDLGCHGSISTIDTVPSFFLRSSAKQMFIRNYQNDTSEFLLYDFNLDVGDTLPVTINNFSNDVVVTSIDSILTPNGYLHRFFISGTVWATYIVEGVGSSAGLVEPMGPIFECGYELQCYGLNDSAYIPTSGPTCNMNVGMVEYDAPQWQVYPNPVIDEVHIQCSVALDKGTLTMLDVHGRTIKTMSNLNGSLISFKRENIPAGMYILKLESGKDVFIRKLLFE